MASFCKSVVVLAASQAVLGFRVTSPHDVLAQLKEEVAKWTFEGKPHMICGGGTIWSLMSGPSADSQNIPWGLIEAEQKQFLERQKHEQTTIENKLADLQTKLDQALLAESLPSTGTDQHKNLISAGVEVFGGMDEAFQYRCGFPGTKNAEGKKLEIRKSFNLGKEAFAKKSADFFQKKEFRLAGDKFLDDCQTLLVKGETDKSYCPRFCQDIKNIAEQNSFDAVGEVAVTSDRIKSEMKVLNNRLTEVVLNFEQCTSDSSSLSAFKDELSGLKGTHEKCNDIWMSAEEGLEDALYSMSDLEDELAEAEEAAATGQKLLAENEGISEDAKAKLEDSINKEKNMFGKVTALDTELAELSADVKAAVTATDLIGKLKEKVMTTMWRMSEFFDAGVREPIRNIGFTEDPADVGFPDTKGLESAEVLKEALTHLHGYCEQSAKPAFAVTLELIPGLDLSPLCGFENVDGMFADLTAQVESRKGQIKADIMTVVSWLNPWKSFTGASMQEGQKMEEKLVEEGQLMFLEQVKAIYQKPANKFFPYLIDWRKDGPHHALTMELKNTLAALSVKEAELKRNLEDMNSAYTESKAATATAKQALDEALAKQAASTEDLASLKEALEGLQEKRMKLQDDIDEWRRKVEEALKAVEKAKEELDQAFDSGIAQ